MPELPKAETDSPPGPEQANAEMGATRPLGSVGAVRTPHPQPPVPAVAPGAAMPNASGVLSSGSLSPAPFAIGTGQSYASNPGAPAGPDPYRVTRLEWAAGKPLSGRYVMVQKLGEGGMGTVYLAEDLLLRRRVAVKTLFDEDAFEVDDIERFRKEVSLAHAISHPNVARTYDFGAAGGVHYITMEHLKGETLMSRIRRGPVLTSKEVRDMAVPLCRGLMSAHRAGVIHRDLKPANIMLVPDERKVVVMDFGIARSIADARGDDLTRTRRPEEGRAASSYTPWDVTSAGLGTPAYMAPEQWDQLSGDTRTDIYALGVILYVCLTGQAPYAADSPTALGDQHRQAQVPDVSSLAKDVDADLASLIRDCLAKDPAKRPQSMEEVLDRLERGQRRKTYALQMAGAVLGSVTVLFLLGFTVFSLSERALLREMKPAMRWLAELVARDIAPDDLDQVRTLADTKKPEFARVQNLMQRYRRENPQLRYFYTMRPGVSPGLYHYVVDEMDTLDRNGNGRIEPNEQAAVPNSFYDGRHLPAMTAVVKTGKPQTDDGFAQDEWEVTLSGYAPVLRDNKPTEYFVGVDVTNDQLTAMKWQLILILGGALVGITAIFGHVLSPARRRKRELAALDQAKAAT